MKALVAVDLEGRYQPALRLCRRLQFENLQFVFANVCPQYGEYAAALAPMAMPTVSAAQSLRASGESAVRLAVRQAGLKRARTIVADGQVAPTLMRLAEENRCALILGGSSRARTSSPWHLDSVTRKLAFAAQQSLLVTKAASRKVGPLDAVFATDHSEYANNCLDLLIKWQPKGIERLHVVTAFEISLASNFRLQAETMVNLDFAQWVEERSRCLAEKAAERLRAIAPNVDVIVERGEPNDVIKRAMKSTGSELLIVGAHGHGFFERLLVGSVSLRQLLAEPYPVLLMRTPSKK